MEAQLPVSVRFGARPLGVILDATFALSPMGLLVAMTLARHANVWLPRGLYTLLDNDSHYRQWPDKMGGSWLPATYRSRLLADLSEELEPWRRAWQNGRLSSRVHWIGDAQYESALPERDESGLLPRFESCCATLDSRVGDLDTLASPLNQCARDVVALSAALQPEAAFILTAVGADAGRPPLCDYIEQLGFPVRRRPDYVPDESGSAFAPALAPMAASGQKAAVVQIVAPVILAMPDAWDEGDWSLEIPETDGDGPDDPWRNACALWHPLASWSEAAA